MKVLAFDRYWQVMQDHFDLGERYGIYEDRFDMELMNSAVPEGANFQPDEWREIPMLGHLQTLLSDDPYYAPEMRTYNAAPWWYRLAFDLSEEEAAQRGWLRFEGVDYYCRIYLNGTLLGEHEGYNTAFGFDVSGLLRTHNALYVKVWSPLEFGRLSDDAKDPRFFFAMRHMLKGTYEHGDSLIHRDCNPVGIWRPVTLELYDRMRWSRLPRADARLEPDGAARVHVEAAIFNGGPELHCTVGLQVYTSSGTWRLDEAFEADLLSGETEITRDFRIESPVLWQTWDRGEAGLYTLSIFLDGMDAVQVRFGIRSIELVRTQTETYFVLNSERQYIRGASYYPEAYLSTMTEGRYRRDLELLRRAGCNLVRVHVHREKPEFYRLCDEMGIAVMQDTDFNWVHPCDDAFTESMLKIVEDEEAALHNHPSVIAWVCLNEPIAAGQPHMGRYDPSNPLLTVQPGPQVYELLKRRSAGCGIIRGSFCENDPFSGDSHNYVGSLDGPDDDYSAVARTTEKFNTEFGFDAPPVPERLWKARGIYRRMNLTRERIDELLEYQYAYLKYFTEYYRLHKYAPTAGHVQFMLIDCTPSTFYGVLDHEGAVKRGMDAFLESNQPLGVFLSCSQDKQALSVVNDYHRAFPGCRLVWRTFGADGRIAAQGEEFVDVQADSLQHIAGLLLKPEALNRVELSLLDGNGRRIAYNRYDRPLEIRPHPKGHPRHFSFTMGVRLY